jgi:hypothetical protein
MSVDESCDASSNTKPPEAATHTRRILAAVAFSYLGGAIVLMFLCGAITLVTGDPQAIVSLSRAMLESCLRLPLLCMLSLVAVTALLTAEIVVELFRFGTHYTRAWSDKTHLFAVLVVWIALCSVQLPIAMLLRR